MNTTAKIGIIVVLLVSVAGILALKSGTEPGTAVEQTQTASEEAAANPSTMASEAVVPGATQTETANTAQTALPRLVDLGAGKCIPCKMMAPILEALKEEYKGRLEVTFLDVWQLPGVAEQYGIQVIPTQIFYDATGKELYRHEGFLSKEDILKKWKEFGIQL